jgi:DNA-binding response OmpR family regulator
MDILIAEDDAVSRRVLHASLDRWGYRVAVTEDGDAAWAALREGGGPQLAILDWMMPGLDGPSVCRLLRGEPQARSTYVILLTARGETVDKVEGLESGADDYLTKPFDREELRARVRVGMRMVALQKSLADRVAELEQALARVHQLQGLLPICSYCKRIRDDGNYWRRVEEYICAHSAARFSHGICPACYDSVVKAQIAGAASPAAPDVT